MAKLNAALLKTLQNPDVIKALAKVGVEPRGTSPEEGAKFLQAEFDKWKKVISDGGIKPN